MNRLQNHPLPLSSTDTSDAPANPFAEARIPRTLAETATDSILQRTLHHGGLIRERMEQLQIQPGYGDDISSVALIATDERCHRSPACILNALMISTAHCSALDLHRLACSVEPVAPLFSAEEIFGVAFFAETRESTAAAIRLRDTLDVIAGELAARTEVFAHQRPSLEIVHQQIGSLPSPICADQLLPTEAIRIRYRGLSRDQVEGLLAEAIQALPPIIAGPEDRIDALAISLSRE